MADDDSIRPERWLPVLNYLGLYEVSDMGRVRSLKRYVRHARGGVALKRGKLRSLSRSPQGYPQTCLYRNSVQETYLVHHLVLEAFDRPRPPGMEALHGPGGPTDNRWPEAIKWGTPSENQGADRHRDGTANNKLTAEIVTACRARHAKGEGWAAIAADYPQVGRTAIWKAGTGETWGHLPMPV